MGYFGLPSKACSPCRSRRIKCDLSDPSCGQCMRARRSCSGYRNQVDLLFHDQSQEVARKAEQHRQTSRRKATKSVAKQAHTKPYASSTSKFDGSKLPNATRPTPFSLPVSAESQAFCFFFSNYPSQSSRNFESIYEEIPALYCSEASESPLSCVVTALGLAGLSHHTDTSGMDVAASIWYEKALHGVNNSLRDQEMVTLDQTLLAVLLLGLYETNTCTTPRSMKSWLKHIKGATALLDLRGEAQLKSEFGRTLFSQARTQIISGCYQTRSPIPETVIQLSKICRDMTASPLEDLNLIAFQLCNFKAVTPFEPRSSQLESTTRATIARCSSIAQALADWHENLPPRFLPSAVCTSTKTTTDDILSSHYDVYEDIWTAGIANNYCANSILVHEALINQLVFLSDLSSNLSEILSLESQISHSRATILSLIGAVCASVPSLLQSSFAAAGVSLLWPLYVSAQISPRTAPLEARTRDWMIGCLEKIGGEMGVRQATMLAGLLHSRTEVTDLLVDL